MSYFALKAALCGLILTAGSASAASQLDPPIRTGLWVMQKLPTDAAGLQRMREELRGSSHLSGVCLNFGWKAIEPERGKINFSAIDQAIAAIHKAGLKYQLCIKPGANTPEFVYADGAKAFPTQVTNPHRANFGATVSIPVPWDPIYERHFSEIIHQLGQHYASDPSCVSVVLTCANFLSAEMHLPKQRTDLSRWAALGNYEEKLLGVYTKFMDEWAQAFPRQDLSLHLSKVLDLPSSFCERIIDYGLRKYPERFSIQNCQLTGRKEDIGNFTYAIIQKYDGRLHHGFQSVAGLSRQNARMGSVEMAALNVVHADGEYWELWHGDGMNPTTTTAVQKAWQEAKKLGYEGYKQKLVAAGQYRH